MLVDGVRLWQVAYLWVVHEYVSEAFWVLKVLLWPRGSPVPLFSLFKSGGCQLTPEFLEREKPFKHAWRCSLFSEGLLQLFSPNTVEVS